MLFINIILTIRTDPGYIPEDSEWDMHSALMDNSEIPEEGGKGP